MSETQRLTIIDIARIAGVSKSTVSRALSDAASISDEAREKVMAAVAVTGFQRNQMARSLRSGRTGMLGLVIPDIANPFWAEVARGAQDEAAEDGVSLLVFSSDWDAARQASHLRALVEARVDGAMVNPVEDQSKVLDPFAMPLVLIGSSAERYPHLSSVGSDISQGVSLALDHLIKTGHTKPVLLMGGGRRVARANFLNAVDDFYARNGIAGGVGRVVEGDYTVEGGRRAIAELIKQGGHEGPISVFAANDLMALGAMLAVREAGLKCPDDVSILGFDGIAGGNFADPGLSTVQKPARAIGMQAVKLLRQEIAGEIERHHEVLPCDLILRGSVAETREPSKRAPRRVGVGR